MRDATNKVLDGARAVNKDIQTFDDLHRHLASHLEDDDAFCRLLETSGYLSVWQIERERNPWQYDLGLMSSLPPDKIEEYCWSVLANDDAVGPNRYILNRGGYELFSREYGLQFFRIMRDIYDHLAALHAQRIQIAVKWLQSNGHLPPSAKPHLTPHTPEWFAALEQWDSPQAMMTRVIVERAGNAEVCSICGDDPASDYRLPEAQRPAGGVDTLRLCNDCLEIRRQRGELFDLILELNIKIPNWPLRSRPQLVWVASRPV